MRPWTAATIFAVVDAHRQPGFLSSGPCRIVPHRGRRLPLMSLVERPRNSVPHTSHPFDGRGGMHSAQNEDHLQWDNLAKTELSSSWTPPEPKGAGRWVEGGHSDVLRLSTFNLLAPCYKRITVTPTATAGAAMSPISLLSPRAAAVAPESQFRSLWRRRVSDTVDFISSELADSDILAFQEYWFDSPHYHGIFRESLEPAYNFHALRRSGGKVDGVAVLLKRGRFDVLGRRGLSLGDFGNRVALLLHLRIRGAAAGNAVAASDGSCGGYGGGDGSAGETELLVVNTHLTFPHNAEDRAAQVRQIQRLTAGVDAYRRERGVPAATPTLLVGDLNADENDPVCEYLRASGFCGAWAEAKAASTAAVSAPPVVPSRGPVTHMNHRGEEVMADHVFIQPGASAMAAAAAAAGGASGGGGDISGGLSVREAVLMPRGVDDSRWSDGFRLSDHRPLVVQLRRNGGGNGGSDGGGM
ncbi:unnamed protein product [Phaeothamnion confervicola]